VTSRFARVLPILLCVSLAPACSRTDTPDETQPTPMAPPRTTPAQTPGPSLRTVNGLRVLTLVGTPEEMGRQHGELLGDDVRWVVKTMIGDVTIDNEAYHKTFITGVKAMEKHLPDRWKRELHALAGTAKVDYWDLVGLQLFGDVGRAQFCSSFAVLGEATSTGECIVGRNFDYFYPSVARRASIIIDYHPKDRHRFLTLTWAGVINGWTLMNEHGIVTANNTAYAWGRNSLEGVSTCFMLRKVAEEAKSVAGGIDLVRKTPRACATNLIIAGGNPPDATVIEYDHERFHARPAKSGRVLATNSFLKLGREDEDEPTSGRYGVLAGLIRKHHGKIDRTMNFAGADGVPLTFINLHSAMLFPRDLTFRAAMGEVPACKSRYRWFRMTPTGIVSAEPVSR